MARAPRIFLAPFRPLPAADLDAIRSRIGADQITTAEGTSAEEVGAALLASGGADVLMSTLLPPQPDAYRGLKWIQLTSAGADQAVRSPVWRDSSVTVTTSSGIHAAAISQWVFAFILSDAQQLRHVAAFKSRRTWTSPHHWPSDWERLAGNTLAGQTLGILGLGSVGLECARIGRAFGMRVVGLRRTTQTSHRTAKYPSPVSALRSAYDEAIEVLAPENLDLLLQSSDYLVITIPGTELTRGLIGERELSLMKPTVVLMNVGRGDVVREEALCNALASKRIRLAVLDVFSEEPLDPNSRLFDLPNAILTPHIAGLFAGYWHAAAQLFIANLDRFVAGEHLYNVVSREVGY